VSSACSETAFLSNTSANFIRLIENSFAVVDAYRGASASCDKRALPFEKQFSITRLGISRKQLSRKLTQDRSESPRTLGELRGKVELLLAKFTSLCTR
jgi:hypothetical protein